MSEKTYRPCRTCCGCREKKEKEELFRIVKKKDGTVSFDPLKKSDGRGAYLCRKRECLSLAKKKKALERTLKTRIPEEVYEALWKELE